MRVSLPSRNRPGFTLIELLVVMAIIATLIGLILPAVQASRARVVEAKASFEIGQIQTAIESFKSTYQQRYIPDILNKGVDASGVDYIHRVWPRYSETNLGTTTDGNATLIFFLTGSQAVYDNSTPTANVLPFSGLWQSASKPLTVGSGTHNLFLEFPASRYNSANQLLDPWGTPYAYFTSHDNAGSYANTSSNGTLPLQESAGKYINPNGYQIISAGANMGFGPGGVWTPGSGSYPSYSKTNLGCDDRANFTPSALGVPR